MSILNKFLFDIIDASLSIISVYRLQKAFLIQINLYKLIIFFTKHLSLLFYLSSFDIAFKDFLEGVDYV